MPPPVHITVDQKQDIPRLVHRQHPDVVSVVCASCVPQFFRIAVKAEKSCQLVVRHIIAVKFIRHREGKHVAAVALLDLHLVPGNPQHNFVIDIDIGLLVKNLLHRSLKIKQIHAIGRIANSVIFVYTIVLCLFPVLYANQIFQIKGACLLRKLPDHNARLCHPSYRQFSPRYLIETGMNRYLMEGSIIPLRIGFQILCQLRRRFPVKCALMEIRDIIKLFSDMKRFA